jgi:MbtH protein
VHERQDGVKHVVVVNCENQYSIWPTGSEIPAGWRPTSQTGNKEECLAYIREVWTDMRPLSLRNKMDLHGNTHRDE